MDLQERKQELETERQQLISKLLINEGALTEINKLNDQTKS